MIIMCVSGNLQAFSEHIFLYIPSSLKPFPTFNPFRRELTLGSVIKKLTNVDRVTVGSEHGSSLKEATGFWV